MEQMNLFCSLMPAAVQLKVAIPLQSFLVILSLKGGDAIETSENIVEGGDYPSLYRSARYGNFSYKFDGLAPGDYFLDLHFAEIVNTCGPKGMRSFDVLVQEEKILSGLDVYAVVGGNRPLQVLDIRVTIESNGAIMIDFKGVRGSPMVCGICIRKAPVLAARLATTGNVLCKKCSADIEVSPIQTRTSKFISKYEKQIEELTSQCNMKSDECYMAWSSVESTNQELDRLRLELHQKVVQSDNFEQALYRQNDQLRNVSQNYENDKKLWAAAISNLERKIKAMKQEQTLLSLEAHDCANSIPDLSKMIGAVQALVAQCEDLKLNTTKRWPREKKLHNIIQDTKGHQGQAQPATVGLRRQHGHGHRQEGQARPPQESHACRHHPPAQAVALQRWRLHVLQRSVSSVRRKPEMGQY